MQIKTVHLIVSVKPSILAADTVGNVLMCSVYQHSRRPLCLTLGAKKENHYLFAFINHRESKAEFPMQFPSLIQSLKY